jgi:Flp pilus assembly protein TadD
MRLSLTIYSRNALLALGIVSAIALGGCQSNSAKNGLNLASMNGTQASSGVDLGAIYRDFKSDDGFLNSMIVAAQKAEAEDRIQDAALFLAKAYDRDSENAELAWRYARLLRMNNRGDKAVILLTPYSVRSNPSDDILREYAASLLIDAKIKTADYIVQQLIDKDSKDPAVWNIAGVVADAGGDTKKAIERFQTGLSYVDQGNERQRSMLLNNMALAKIKSGDKKAAQQDISLAMTGAQYYPQIRDNYDTLNYLQDRPDMSTGADMAKISPVMEGTASYPLPLRKPAR